ncbi:hypothetical protein Y590_25575 (plasmid) [Methylobacterium sp. AMS5]|nr:hypothetical protein Y590_25575 [Methylobacterium sp. AMS5]
MMTQTQREDFLDFAEQLGQRYISRKENSK